MDKDSRAVESRERAVSSEPCSTRPNPFDEDDVSSRKRRRTSLTDSRSRSVDTVQSNPNDTLTGSLELQPGDRSAMKVDADRPGTPRSPERTAAPAPAEPRSSRVTLNLRSGATALDAIPSSPLSPAQELSPGPDEDIKASVEPAEMDVPVPKTAGPIDQEASSSTMSDDPTSPEIEIITVPDDDDMVTYGDADGIAIIREIRRDPTDDIPFRDPPGTPVDAILRIVQYLGNCMSRVKRRRGWHFF